MLKKGIIMIPILQDLGLKNRKIQIYLSVDEYEFFKLLAKRHEESAAFFIRQAVKTYIQIYKDDLKKE